ncbi:hypothetical protein [Sphingomonas sp. GM_Shp_2]|uniref:hypothetical protein n=1 Tax=Sphingomonas sp. GM_Shp_2 TaxID=2937380 RepID=UPI002269E46F|nr:hypothetical protein [Sphingomonas sp. GM_Shp_2]
MRRKPLFGLQCSIDREAGTFTENRCEPTDTSIEARAAIHVATPLWLAFRQSPIVSGSKVNAVAMSAM